MSELQTQDTKTYELDGVSYRLESLSFQQCQWMGQHVLFDTNLGDLSDAQVHDLVRSRGHLLAAIALIPAGKTRKDKSEQAWDDIQLLSRHFATSLAFEQLEAVAVGFFFVNPLASLMGMQSGAQIQAIREKSIRLAIENQSPTLSRSLPMATSPDCEASAPNGDQRTPESTSCSSDGASTGQPSAPSLASAG